MLGATSERPTPKYILAVGSKINNCLVGPLWTFNVKTSGICTWPRSKCFHVDKGMHLQMLTNCEQQ